ncbi:MAG: sulfotransferase [Chloroflexi bacterium]|nr:sulfotransferase [Chloroflexota bacterium]
MILICGSGRSGTSAVARLLHEAGISMGNDLIEPDEFNAEGYFEERGVVRMNDALLNDVKLHTWFATASRQDILAAARARGDGMRELAAQATPAWKDPRFSWTLEAWMEVLPEKPRVIVCLRSPAEVVASTLRYYGLSGDEPTRAVEHTWRAQYERLLDVIAEYGLEAIGIEYGALFDDPAAAIAPLERFVGRKLDAGGVRRDLRHHKSAVSGELRAVYDRVAALGAEWRVGPAPGQLRR